MINEDEGFEKYGDVPLYFSHYYNFLFIYKSKVMENGDQITLQLGGKMEKVSAMVVDVNDPLTLNEKADNEYAHIKNKEKQGKTNYLGTWCPCKRRVIKVLDMKAYEGHHALT